MQFAEAERSNFKSRTTIQADGVELQLSLMDMDGRFTNEQKLERARKAMTAQAQRKLDMIGKISKALGMDVVVHDYMRGSNGYFGEDGKIHFVLSGHMSVARVAAHELTHQMQSVASEKYTVVRDQLIEDVGQDRFDRLLKRKAAQYGYNMESEQGRLACDEEVIAELCEGMLSDKDRLERFAERHTDTALTLKDRLTKILNAIHATLKDTFGQNQNRISDMITDEKTADKWLDGLDEVLKKVQEKQQTKEFSDAGTKFSIREEAPPVKTGIAYKVFFVKDGKLYPPMVANPGGADTPIGVWLNADVGAAAPDSKTGRQQVKAGGKGTQGGSGSLAFRPGWHLGDIPRASQFDRLNQATGKKELFPENFVWAECEYAKDVDYQKEAMSYGYTENGKYRHSYAGLPRIPKDGYYRYRTNPNPETVPWVITGAMKVNRLLSDAEVNSILEKNGVAPVHRQGGDVSLEDLGFANVQAQQNVAKFALEIVDGKKIAWVENSGLSRKDLQNYKKVAEYIGEHIGEAYTIIESGSKVYIGEDLPGEYTQSEYTRRLLAKNRAALFAKKKAVGVFGDMIEIATNRRWEKTKHTHNKDAKYGMYRYDTCFAFPVKNNAGKVVDVKAYDAELLIRNASNGKKYLYDIVNIKENTDYQPELQQRKSRKGGAMLPADSGVSSGTMTQNGESVKGKFSLDEEYRKAVSSGNVQEQQKLVEQAAKEAGYTKLFYHGSKKGGGFTTFKNWQYFTENKQYAQRYAGGENGLYTTYVKMENTFDTRQAEARSLFNEARQELGLSKLQENGLPDWTDGYDLSEYIEENDLPYDSIILDEGGDMVNGKPVSRGLSYVIRNPEQIKSADAVTYDDAGNVIPLSERFNMEKKDIRYALDTDHYDYSRSFAQQIDDYMAGKFPRNDTFVLGKTPDIFQKVGLSALPMTMDQVHVDYALNGTKNADHQLGAALLKQLPTLMEKPVAIIESATHPDNSVMAIVKGEVNGKQVTAAVRVGGTGRQNGVIIDSNHLVSVQGRQNAVSKLLVQAMEKENAGETGVYYINKTEAQDLCARAGLQLPGSAAQDGLIHSIFDAGSPVNRKYGEQTETRQFKRWFGDSKVVDKKGAPRKLYHYTDGEFTVFDTGKSGSNQGMRLGDGIYLSTSPTEFSSYGKNRMELYATISNPFEMQLTDEQANAVLDKYASTKHDLNAYDGVYRNHAFAKLTNPVRVMDYLQEYAKDNGIKVSDILKDLGYDGVHDGMEWVAFEPGQVKSATDNIGTFDRNNPDIRYSLDTEQLEKTVRAIDTKALEEGLQSMTLTSNVNSFTMKDPSRFFDAISKNNTELREELHDIFEKPHSEATGKYARGIKDMQERVRNIATEAGILSKDGKKFDKAASAAVQNIGEGIAPIACSVEAKVVEADTISLKATRNDSEILSGNCTLEAQFFEIWKKLVERQSNIKPLTRERLLPEYRRIL